MINIHDFCAKKDEPRWYLNSPIPYHGFLYATNGHIAVRVPQASSLPDTEHKIGAQLARIFETTTWEAGMEPLPVYPPVLLSECDRCHGSGKVSPRDECKECRGEGLVEWDSGQNTYEASCKGCDGGGEVDVAGLADRTCDQCDGECFILDAAVTFGATAINYRYLSMMERLPNLLVGLSGKKYPDPIPFSFDDGQGIVMPIKPIT